MLGSNRSYPDICHVYKMDIKIWKICGKSMRKTLLKKIAYIVNKHK